VFPFANALFSVKFYDPDTGLECDINVNDQLGFINSSMMGHYVSLQPALIPLLRLIKRWARNVGMNSPSKRPVSFSSYTLTLMTIAWFQVRSLIRSSDLRLLTSAQVIGMATESPGGRIRRKRCADGPLLDKE
jgi:DNA polymerase sigma